MHVLYIPINIFIVRVLIQQIFNKNLFKIKPNRCIKHVYIHSSYISLRVFSNLGELRAISNSSVTQLLIG